MRFRNIVTALIRIVFFMLAIFVARNLYDAADQGLQDAHERAVFADQGNTLVRFRAIGITKRTLEVTLLAPAGDRACGTYLKAFEREDPAKREELREHGYVDVECGDRVVKIR
jgi:hypothetical protein